MVGGDEEKGATALKQRAATPFGQRLPHRLGIGGANLGEAGQDLPGSDGHVVESDTTLISKEYRSAG